MTETKSIKAGERTQHTSGPWYCGDAQLKSSRRVFMPNDTVEIRCGGNSALIACLYKTNFPQKGMDEANARLIAAAPALFEALEDIVEQFEKTKLMVGADLSDSIRVFGKGTIAIARGKS